MKILQPLNWKRPSGYSNGIKAEGETIFVAGQVGWNENCEFASDDLVDQIRQALKNIVTVLKEGNARQSHIVRMTWYVTDLGEYRSAKKEIGEAYREIFGNHYPAMSLVEVAGLMEDGAKVEIEATAVLSKPP